MATINGGPFNDTLDGTNNRDIINGLGGDDTLNGLGGADTLDGGTGIDSLAGGFGDDTYIVDDQMDNVSENGSEGKDTVRASVSYMLGQDVENLVLTGTDSIDGTGNGLNNTITGNSGDNSIDGGAGADVMAGALGNDTFFVDDLGDRASDTGGLDRVESSVSFTLGAGIEDLLLTGIDDTNATGNNLANSLTGNDGDNTLNGMAGTDVMEGGDGDDTFIVDNAGDSVYDNNGTDTVRTTLADYTLGADIENLFLDGNRRSNGTGNNNDNLITGNRNVNTLTGLDGNDTLDGGIGADTMIGGEDDDTYYVDNARDVVTEDLGEGTDEVRATVSHTLTANAENLSLLGTANLSGTGNAEDNTINGNSGNNILDGGAGVDALAGGLGNDTYVLDDLMDGASENPGEGIDTVKASFSYTLGQDFENLTLTGIDDIDGTGNAGVNVITGNTGDNTLDGDAGADRLYGGAGNDTYVIDDLGDIVADGSGTDTVQSGVSYTLANGFENLVLTGTDNIYGGGNRGVNDITGNDGENLLRGFGGNDMLAGGFGEDTFIFEAKTALNGVDTISDFSLMDGDALDLRNLLKAYDAMDDQLSDFVQITDSGLDSIVSVDMNGARGGINFVQVATLSNITGLNDEDALVLSGNLIVS
jgi:Ca2+-binding RTX toxin-like protein